MAESETPKFVYLLNALEGSAHSENPFIAGYAGHRAKVLDYVANLERELQLKDQKIAELERNLRDQRLLMHEAGMQAGELVVEAHRRAESLQAKVAELERDAPPISELVNLFLAWPLPSSVSSDGCVTNRNYPHLRFGTNLLTADEARQMLEYVLSGAPSLDDLADELIELLQDDLAKERARAESLKSQLAAAQENERRYFWLKKNASIAFDDGKPSMYKKALTVDTLDAAIDAAQGDPS